MTALKIASLLVATSMLTAVLGGVLRQSLGGWPFQLMLGTAVITLTGTLLTVIYILLSELFKP